MPELPEFKIPNDKILPAIISLFPLVLARLDVLELRLDGLAKGEAPISAEVSDKLFAQFVEEYQVEILARVGQ
jgi:hypothetical protein